MDLNIKQPKLYIICGTKYKILIEDLVFKIHKLISKISHHVKINVLVLKLLIDKG